MLSDLKFSFVNIDQKELSTEIRAKVKYYANVIHWTLIYALPLFWLLDYSFLSNYWLVLLAIRIMVVFFSHCIYVYGNLKKNNWNVEVTMSFIIGMNTIMYAAICATLPVLSVQPYFLTLSIFYLLLNITIFWKPRFSVIQCFVSFFTIIVLYYFINKNDGYPALISNGGGVFFVLSIFSCLVGYNRYQLAKRSVANSLIIEMACNRLIDQNQKIIDQQNEIKAFNKKIEQISAYRYNTLNMILHDFRNFTGSIQMSLDILNQTQENLTTEQKEVFGYIGEGNEKLKYLSEKLAASAITQDNKIDYEFTDVELGAEVEQVIVDLNDAATMKQISLQLNIDPSSSVVHLDKIFLNELLVKLLSSVIRYTSSNAIVSIHLHKLDGKVVTDIASKGKVLGLKMLEQLFNDEESSAISTETVSKNTSGFSIAKKLAENMGGKITYNSDEITGNFYRLEFNLSNK